MSKKRSYRAVSVEKLNPSAILAARVAGEPVVVAIDVAKASWVAAVSTSQESPQTLVAWQHPRQTHLFLDLVTTLGEGGHPVVAVMEPTGTYGDPVRYQLEQRGVPVHRVSPKQVHDAAELFDGVPSKHDCKDACVIAWLYHHGKSQPWPPMNEEQRALRALVDERELYDGPKRVAQAKLEALLARHFPELDREFEVARRPSLWRLLQAFASPADIANNHREVRPLLARWSRGKMSVERIDRLVELAKTSTGERMDAPQRRLLQQIVRELLRCQQELDRVDAAIEEMVQTPELEPLRKLLGPTTVAVLIAHLGSPADYSCARAFQKACGLNLKERSSGKHVGQLRITKRGSGTVRKYLYLAALRLVQMQPVMKAWYLKRKAYQAKLKQKAVVAVMRKLALAIFHVARGDRFDAQKLVDVRTLPLAVLATGPKPATAAEEVVAMA